MLKNPGVRHLASLSVNCWAGVVVSTKHVSLASTSDEDDDDDGQDDKHEDGQLAHDVSVSSSDKCKFEVHATICCDGCNHHPILGNVPLHLCVRL